MTRTAYAASASQFIDDWDKNEFMPKMCRGAAPNHNWESLEEKKSWKANGAKMRSLLALAHMPLMSLIVVRVRQRMIILSGAIHCAIII